MVILTNIWIVLKKEWREQQSASFRLSLLWIPALLIAIAAFIANGMPEAVLALVARTQLTYTALGATTLVASIFTPPLYAKERASKTQESLLATPLGIVEICLGKAALSWLIGLATAAVGTIGELLVYNLALPPGHLLLPTLDAAVFALALLPVVSGALSALIAFLLMTGQPPATIHGLLNLLSFCLMGGPGFARGALPSGWALNGWFLAAAIVLLLVDIVLGRRMTIEQAITGYRPRPTPSSGCV